MRTLIILIILSNSANAQRIDNSTMRHLGAGVVVGGLSSYLSRGTDDSRLLKAVGITMGATLVHGLATKKPDLSGIITAGTGAVVGAFIANLIQKRRVCRL